MGGEGKLHCVLPFSHEKKRLAKPYADGFEEPKKVYTAAQVQIVRCMQLLSGL
jgi:hypothetical protein